MLLCLELNARRDRVHVRRVFFCSGVLLGTRDAALRINDTKIKTDWDGEVEKKKREKSTEAW